MKRFLSVLLVAVTVLGFCACGEKEPDISPLVSATEKTNSLTAAKGDYQLEITFGSGTVLCFSAGEVEFDRGAQTAHAELSTTYLGISSVVTNHYADGKMISIDNGESLEYDESAEEVFSHFPYCTVPVPDYKSCKDFEFTNSNGKDAFSFVYTDGKSLCELVVGEDLYELAAVINDPQEEKTRYSEVDCTYSYDENGLSVVRYSFEVTLFDREPYTPGHSVPEEEYSLSLKIVARLKLKT